MVWQAFERIISPRPQARPRARIEGVTVQAMIKPRTGIEMILGAKKDPTFGTVIMAGFGGVEAELFRDRVLGFPPLNERLARRMLESLKDLAAAPGLQGPAARQRGQAHRGP